MQMRILQNTSEAISDLVMIMRPRKFFIKSLIAVSIFLVLLSAIIISLDGHYIGSSATCAICKAKSCLSDDLYSYHLNYYPLTACYQMVEYIAGIIILYAFLFKNKAPPALYNCVVRQTAVLWKPFLTSESILL
jgi:hypothetical protein